MGEIAVIYNPNAKRNRKDPLRAGRFATILGSAGRVYETVDLNHMDDCVRQLAERNPEIICICGGDGTIQKVLTSVVMTYQAASKQLPMLHFLKGGSMNTVSWSIGLRSAAETALGALVERHDNNIPFDVEVQQTLRVNDNYGFIFGNGVVVNFLDEYYASENSGPSRAAEITYKAISSVLSKGDFYKKLAERLPAKVVCNGNILPLQEYLMILVGAVEYIGIGFKTLYRAKEKPGCFHMFATGLTPGKILGQLHRFFTGKRLVGENHFDELATEIEIETSRARKYVLDGEIYSASRVSIRPGQIIKIVKI